ncbi:MAG: hypothetical protein ACLPKB_34245 [Xanthobacteraceae bacterium]
MAPIPVRFRGIPVLGLLLAQGNNGTEGAETAAEAAGRTGPAARAALPAVQALLGDLERWFGPEHDEMSSYEKYRLRRLRDAAARLKLWEATTGRLTRTFVGHSASVTSVAFSPDGARILSAAGDRTAKFWKAGTGELLATVIRGEDGEWLAVTPEGFFAASKKGADLLSVARGLEVYSIDQLY